MNMKKTAILALLTATLIASTGGQDLHCEEQPSPVMPTTRASFLVTGGWHPSSGGWFAYPGGDAADQILQRDPRNVRVEKSPDRLP